LSQSSNEIILTQEQSVTGKFVGPPKRELEGTLVLTNKRMIFVAADQTIGPGGLDGEPAGEKIARETSNLGMDMVGGSLRVSYADVEDLSKISEDPKNLIIPISSITSVTGHRGLVSSPNLKLNWKDSKGETASVEFHQILTNSSRKKNLSDWANVVQKLRDGTLTINSPDQLPAKDSLEGRVYYVMGDMQTKGNLQIEEETEERFGIELEPEEVQTACDKLVGMGLLDEISDPSGDSFYKKHSPLGENDLSS
jgi:hypothetical protein